tara:strand:- start:325 stop:909 length:585 start_codon:yes stop_codon:yes gene_type:complete
MSISLQDKDTLNLSENTPGLRKVIVGAGWDLDQLEGRQPMDVDLTCFLLDVNEQTREDEDFVFYNNLEAAEGAVVHKGDNRTGSGEGDDEIIFIDLAATPMNVARITFVASIYEGPENGYEFSQVKNAYIRIYDEDTKAELARYNLSRDFPGEQAIIFGSLIRMGDKWEFETLGEPASGGLSAIAKQYGLMIAE